MPSSARKYREIPLPLNAGQVTQYEESLLPDGAMSVIENFTPEETGGVRVREGWSKSSLTGGPGTSKGLSVFTYGKSNTGAIRQRKNGTADNASGNDITLAWDIPTLAGSTLVIKMMVADASKLALRPSDCAGYQQIKIDDGDANDSPMALLLVKEDAAAESEALFGDFMVGGANPATEVHVAFEMIEYTGVVVVSSVNLLPNMAAEMESVETSGSLTLDGWTSDAATLFNRDTVTPQGGYGAIEMQNPAAGSRTFTYETGLDGVPVNGSTQYTFSIYMRSSAGTLTPNLQVNWYDSGGAFISTSSQGVGAALTSSFVRREYSPTSPSGARFAAPQVTITNGNSVLDAFFDNAQFQQSASATTWVRGKIGCFDVITLGLDAAAEAAPPVSITPSGSSTVDFFWGDATVWGFSSTISDLEFDGWTNNYEEQAQVSNVASVTSEGMLASATRQFTTQGAFATAVTVTTTDTLSPTDTVYWVIYALRLDDAALTDNSQSFYIANNIPDASTLEFWSLDPENLASGTWSQIGSDLTVTHGSIPVAGATGLGIIMFAHPKLPLLKYWTGSGPLVDVTASPQTGRSMAFFKSRFWTGGGDNFPTRLSYSDVGDPDSWPTTNFLEAGQDDGWVIEDLGVQENILIVGKGNSLFSLSGSGADNFGLFRFSSGNAAPGRSVCPTPYGCIVAGTKDVWQISGTLAESISGNLGAAYSPTSRVHTAYLDNRVYILDQGADKIFVCDLRTQAWHVEKHTGSNDQLRALICDGPVNRLIGSPNNSTTSGLVQYKVLPSLTRTRDYSPITSVATFDTGQVWPVGPASAITPRKLFLQVRQRGSGTEDATIQSYYNGVAATAQTISNQAAAGSYRYRFDLGHKAGVNSIRFVMTGPSSGNQFEVEQAWLGFVEEEVR